MTSEKRSSSTVVLFFKFILNYLISADSNCGSPTLMGWTDGDTEKTEGREDLVTTVIPEP